MKNPLLIVCLIQFLFSTCGMHNKQISRLDSKEIIKHRLTHGIGVDPFEQEIFQDSIICDLFIETQHPSNLDEIGNHIGLNNENLKERLNTLIKYGLIKKNNEDIYFSTFPIIVDHISEYRHKTRQVAIRVFPKIKNDIETILEISKTNGWEAWNYHIIWSQLFDSQFIWFEMMDKQLVPLLTEPVWWIIYPRNSNFIGTNYYSSDFNVNFLLTVSWKPSGSNTLGWIGGQAGYIFQKAFTNMDLQESSIQSLSKINLLDSNLNLNIPIISSRDVLYQELNETAKKYCALLEKEIDLDKFDFINSDRKIIWAMIYHDISWEILGLLADEGRIKLPKTLRVPDYLDMTGVSALIEIYPPWKHLLGF